MNSMSNARNGNVRRRIAVTAVNPPWDAGAARATNKVKALTAKQRAAMAAARPLPKADSDADREAIAAYLARVAR
jgi:hypothetical protein